MTSVGKFALTMGLAALFAGCGGLELPMGAPSAESWTLPRTRVSSLTSAAPRYETVFEFNGANGANPASKLVELNGKLYGTTMGGGSYSGGTIFSITRDGKEAVVHSFGASGDGNKPEAGLVVLHGVLFGTTYSGGPFGFGSVFSVTPEGKERVLHLFRGSNKGDGANPTAGLTVLKGTLYGITEGGGIANAGTVFSITPTGKERIVYRFPYNHKGDGRIPWGGLIAVNGLLYGTDDAGGKCYEGTVFSLTTAGKEHILHNFSCLPDYGRWAMADLVHVDNVFYGTTEEGGHPFDNGGEVFSLTADGNFSEFFFFEKNRDGCFPRGALILVHGLLYGTASGCANNRSGVVFSITRSGYETVLHTFGHPHDGRKPYAGLINVAGTLYGTTSLGGNHGNGTVYKISLPR